MYGSPGRWIDFPVEIQGVGQELAQQEMAQQEMTNQEGSAISKTTTPLL